MNVSSFTRELATNTVPRGYKINEQVLGGAGSNPDDLFSTIYIFSNELLGHLYALINFVYIEGK